MMRIFLILVFLCTLAGCTLAEVKQDGSGANYTEAERILGYVGTTLKDVGGVVPGIGPILRLAGEGVILVGGMITSYVMIRRRGKALDTTIKGVEEASQVFDRVRDLLLNDMKVLLKEDDYKKMESVLMQATSIKELIAKIAGYAGTEKYLNSRLVSLGMSKSVFV